MARIVCVAGSQPAFGKTTTAVNLSVALAMAGQQALLVDWNPKADSTRQFALTWKGDHPWSATAPSIASESESITDGLKLLAGNWTVDSAARVEAWTSEDCRARGTRWIAETASHDVVLIDCPSSLGPFTESALWAADEVLIPLRCESTALEQVPELVHLIRRVLAEPSKDLGFAGVLITQYDPHDPLSQRNEDQIREFFGDIVFETIIPQDEVVAEAQWRRRPLLDLAPQSRAAFAYIELGMEVLGR